MVPAVAVAFHHHAAKTRAKFQAQVTLEKSSLWTFILRQESKERTLRSWTTQRNRASPPTFSSASASSVPKGSDRIAELKHRLQLWEAGDIGELVG